ncbi:hypothetical protein Thein_0496 [Thermodesulfatator indicus DSM 15286]|uniref:Cytochrome b561 bacterial/Ni-hydrogenase domain-containing protein n=1 Tax=Thermodesulfatator indicus (strain DSM 15286 / JCM 11887 / CIR29812) TaxID=667014 RepID=F8AB12_THEID|nr:cytochrome b/b6 domain-containing protein [Thermodesulfatator indicus]AEH44378.1 hypothetical protein Thein_0496 [Thermodesulfatator indicus DSM 15286]
MDRVLKFSFSEKIFHNVNAVTWYILALTGVIVYFDWASPETKAFLMQIHIWVAVIFTFNFLAFVFLSPHRFYIMMKNFLEWDKDSLAWFKNFGGYPRRFFKIPFGPEEVAPQGKVNAGQKLTYLFFVFVIIALIVTGWSLYYAKHSMGKTLFELMFYVHVWGSILATAVATCGHIPLSIVNTEDLLAMWRPGSGTVSVEWAKHHNPKWYEKDLMKVEPKED